MNEQLPIQPPIVLPTKAATARLPRGKGLESLVLASQFGVILTKVPSGVRWTGRNQVTPTATPVDFFGMHLATKRLMVFDAKECKLKTRLETSVTHFAEHQRQMLIRYGEMGGISGLLVEATTMLQLFWVPWRLLSPRRPSYQWDELVPLGPSNLVITAARWDKVIADDERGQP